jgi:hypothetical protein
MKVTEDQIAEYVSMALYFTSSIEQIIGMVILHFDIPDKQAKSMTMAYLKQYKPSVLKEIRT